MSRSEYFQVSVITISQMSAGVALTPGRSSARWPVLILAVAAIAVLVVTLHAVQEPATPARLARRG